MDKKEALRVLIVHSFFLEEEDKQKLLAKVSELSDEEIESLGRFLALEKQQSLENNQEAIQAIDQILEKIEEKDSAS